MTPRVMRRLFAFCSAAEEYGGGGSLGWWGSWWGGLKRGMRGRGGRSNRMRCLEEMELFTPVNVCACLSACACVCSIPFGPA